MVNKISLMEFYQLEAIRRADYKDEEILEHLASGDVASLQKAIGTFDFEELLALYKKSPEQFNQIITEGYQIKFLTFPGLQRLLEMKFDRIADMDFDVEEDKISKLQLNESELARLKQILSPNWQVQQDTDGSYRVILR